MKKKIITTAILGLCLVPLLNIQFDAETAKQDQLIDGQDMDIHYTSVVSGVNSVEDLYNDGYISMYYPNGKEVSFDLSGDQYKFMLYFVILKFKNLIHLIKLHLDLQLQSVVLNLILNTDYYSFKNSIIARGQYWLLFL